MPRYLPLTERDKRASAYMSLRVPKKVHRWLRDRAIVEDRQIRHIVIDLVEKAMAGETSKGASDER